MLWPPETVLTEAKSGLEDLKDHHLEPRANEESMSNGYLVGELFQTSVRRKRM